MPMSQGSVTGRISISTPTSTWPSAFAWREAHSMASSSDFARTMLKPADGSLPPSKGPLMTVRVPPENLSRTPSELARSPSAPSSAPVFARSPRSVPTRAIKSALGIAPASQCALVLCMMMNRMGRQL